MYKNDIRLKLIFCSYHQLENDSVSFSREIFDILSFYCERKIYSDYFFFSLQLLNNDFFYEHCTVQFILLMCWRHTYFFFLENVYCIKISLTTVTNKCTNWMTQFIYACIQVKFIHWWLFIKIMITVQNSLHISNYKSTHTHAHNETV